MREPAMGNPSAFEPIRGLAGRKMADGEGRHVPRIVLAQERDALVIHDVAMLDAMGAEPDRILHCIRVGGMRHDLEAALPADLEGSADLVFEQEGMGVEVPCRPHDPAREVKLDMVDAVLDLLADGFHPTIGAVNLERMTRGQEVSACGGQEITAGEQPRADMLSGVEGPLPCDVHEVMGAGAAQSDNAGFGKRGREPVAEQGHLIGERHLVEGQVIGMDVHVPEAGIRNPPLRSISCASPALPASPLGRMARMRPSSISTAQSGRTLGSTQSIRFAWDSIVFMAAYSGGNRRYSVQERHTIESLVAHQHRVKECKPAGRFPQSEMFNVSELTACSNPERPSPQSDEQRSADRLNAANSRKTGDGT